MMKNITHSQPKTVKTPKQITTTTVIDNRPLDHFIDKYLSVG